MRRRNKACYLDGEALVNVEIEGSAGRFAECRKKKEMICIGIYIYISKYNTILLISVTSDRV